MNVVALIGSPHGMQGNTGQLLQHVVQSIEAGGAAANVLCVADMNVAACRDCGVCHKTGTCAIDDDFKTIKDALLSADGVVLASPNYVLSVTAQMKLVLDRCCEMIHHLPLEGKYGAAVVTSGGGGEEVENYVVRFLQIMGCWTVGSVGATAAQLADGAMRKQKAGEARGLGARLLQAIGNKDTFPEQETIHREFFQRMKQLVIARKEQWPFEYEYWRSRGWL
jgi:multimeric flavodoxin WrbA